MNKINSDASRKDCPAAAVALVRINESSKTREETSRLRPKARRWIGREQRD
jgi:hypothetical protein